MEAYGEAFSEGTTMVLSPDSDFFRYFGTKKK
jgi:membrane protease subunit HflC